MSAVGAAHFNGMIHFDASAISSYSYRQVMATAVTRYGWKRGVYGAT